MRSNFNEVGQNKTAYRHFVAQSALLYTAEAIRRTYDVHIIVIIGTIMPIRGRRLSLRKIYRNRGAYIDERL